MKSLQIWWVFHRIWQVSANLLRDLVRSDEISTGFSDLTRFSLFFVEIEIVATSIDFDWNQFNPWNNKLNLTRWSYQSATSLLFCHSLGSGQVQVEPKPSFNVESPLSWQYAQIPMGSPHKSIKIQSQVDT